MSRTKMSRGKVSWLLLIKSMRCGFQRENLRMEEKENDRSTHAPALPHEASRRNEKPEEKKKEKKEKE